MELVAIFIVPTRVCTESAIFSLFYTSSLRHFMQSTEYLSVFLHFELITKSETSINSSMLLSLLAA